MNNQEEQIEIMNNAIESLVVIRSQIAGAPSVNMARVDEGMQHTGRAFSLLWDLRYNRKGGGS